MPELLPCPFCGGSAERLFPSGTIRCKTSLMKTHDGDYPCPAFNSTVRVAWMWNRRQSYLPQEDVETLQAAVALFEGDVHGTQGVSFSVADKLRAIIARLEGK